MASGMAHTLVVLSNGEVWGWGVGRKGQLGEPCLPAVFVPRKIDVGVARIGRAVCGREFSVLVVEGSFPQRIMFLGNDKYDVRAPLSACAGVVISDIQASWNGVYLLESTGALRAWGKNDKGQLPPPNLCNVKGIAVGSEHVLAILEEENTGERKLIAWGWGEHGNCGRPGSGDAVGGVFELKIPDRGSVMRIGAGCATSWVWVE
jgi:protein ATS1